LPFQASPTPFPALSTSTPLQRIVQSDTKNIFIKSQKAGLNEASVIQTSSILQVNKCDSVTKKTLSQLNQK